MLIVMSNLKKGMAINTVGALILVVIIIAVVGWWITFYVVPVMGDEVSDWKDSVMGISTGCENIEPINISRCAEGVNCDVSTNYTEFSTFSVKIPVSTVYWIDVEVARDCCWADTHYNSADPKEVQNSNNCSDNDPNLFNPYEYEPLIYEFRIGDVVGNYTFDPALSALGGNENISVYMGPVNEGSYTVKWRIITPWAAGGGHSCNPSGSPACGGACSGTGGCERVGTITSETMRVYCEGI